MERDNRTSDIAQHDKSHRAPCVKSSYMNINATETVLLCLGKTSQRTMNNDPGPPAAPSSRRDSEHTTINNDLCPSVMLPDGTEQLRALDRRQFLAWEKPTNDDGQPHSQAPWLYCTRPPALPIPKKPEQDNKPPTSPNTIRYPPPCRASKQRPSCLNDDCCCARIHAPR